MLIGIIVYFLLATAVGALLLLAPVREWAFASVRHLYWHCQGFGAGIADELRHRNKQSTSVLFAISNQLRIGGSHAREGGTWVRRHWTWFAVALAVLTALPAIAWFARSTYRVDSFDHTASREVDERVAALLQGEQLVPPPPLPPELFTTPEVEQWQPMAGSASRQWELLDEAFRQRLLLAFKLMHDRHGIDPVLIEGYRSPARQAALAALGPTVTRAGAFESYHQYGLAADVAFLRNGHIVISERDPWAMKAYQSYGEITRALGMTWGGDWQSLKDYGHVELHRTGVPTGAGPRPTIARDGT